MNAVLVIQDTVCIYDTFKIDQALVFYICSTDWDINKNILKVEYENPNKLWKVTKAEEYVGHIAVKMEHKSK